MPMDWDNSAVQILKPRCRGGRAWWIVAAGVATAAATVCALGMGRRSGDLPSSVARELETVEVDRGDLALVVTEKGALESSLDDVIRCRVEPFLSLPSGPPVASSESRTPPARGARTRVAGVSPASGMTEPTVTGAIQTKERPQPKDRGRQVPGQSGTSGASATPADARGAPGAGVASVSAGSSSIAAATTPDSAPASRRPVIRSFDYVVEPHVPLRSSLPGQGVISITPPPPPTILTIVPEGTFVKAGDVVCELDSSGFRDALRVQQIRCVQAKAWALQAKYIIAANEIALREYERGILPQDTKLVRQHIAICQIERDQAARNLAWSRRMRAKGFRSAAQVDADAAVLEQAEFTLSNAGRMLDRLINYTAIRILHGQRVKIAASRSDLLTLESAFRLEGERLERIKTMIANCTMRAPRDGIVCHANRTSGWGTGDKLIREGLTVHQSQPIFRLLDSSHLQVSARINESQIARIRLGQPVLIHLVAFPDRILRGSVAEILPIPALTNGPFSDVRSFFATIRIESGGFDALRSGMSAEVDFLVTTRRQVPRVPLEAVRWVGDRSFAARLVATETGVDWLWQPIAVGATDTTFAEVVSGLEPGDRVIAQIANLPTEGPGLPDESGTTLDLALQGHPAQ
jgi:HlyD family secretion protein